MFRLRNVEKCASSVWITYKLAVLVYKVRTTLTPAYLSRHIRLRDSVWTLHSATTTRLSELFTSTAFVKRFSAPATWNRSCLPRTVTGSNLLGTFKSRLKSLLCSHSYNWYITCYQRLWSYELTALHTNLLLWWWWLSEWWCFGCWQVVQYKQQSRLDEKRKKAMDMHLSFIVDQTEKYSTWLTEGLAATSAAASVEPSPTTTTTQSSADTDKSERATSVDVDGLYWSHFLSVVPTTCVNLM